jgi:cytochrome P450
MPSLISILAPDEMPQNIVTALDPETHARFRKLLSNSFTETALRNQSPLIDSYADLLIDRLWKLATETTSQGNGSVVNVVDWASWFTVDIIGDLAFGESFDCLKKSELHPWVNTLNNFLKGMVFAATTRWYPSVESLVFKFLPKSVMDLQKQHSDFANEKINRRLNLEKDRADIITPFMRDNARFQHISLKETQSNFQILLVAGADTTATALSGTFLYLMENPRVLQKLVSEIRAAFATESAMNVAAVKDLPYLNVVLSEALRLTNPVPGGLPRIVPKGGDVYAGVFIPEGVCCPLC